MRGKSSIKKQNDLRGRNGKLALVMLFITISNV